MEKEWQKIAHNHGFTLNNWNQKENRYDFDLIRDGKTLSATIRIFDEKEDEEDEFEKVIEFYLETYSENTSGIYFEFGSEFLHDIYVHLKEKGRTDEHEIIPGSRFILDLKAYRSIKEDKNYQIIEEKIGHFIQDIRNNKTDEGVEEGAFDGEVGKRIAEFLEKKGLGKKKKFCNGWLFYFDPYCPHEVYDEIDKIKEKWGA